MFNLGSAVLEERVSILIEELKMQHCTIRDLGEVQLKMYLKACVNIATSNNSALRGLNNNTQTSKMVSCYYI